jgi:hypothetical protein
MKAATRFPAMKMVEEDVAQVCGNGHVVKLTWVNRLVQMVEVSAVSEEEKQQAKSLLARISENKLVNTIIVAVVGEATKAVLPHK